MGTATIVEKVKLLVQSYLVTSLGKGLRGRQSANACSHDRYFHRITGRRAQNGNGDVLISKGTRETKWGLNTKK